MKKPPYSILYVEEGCEAYPVAQRILSRLSCAVRIPVRDYKEFFNRPGQNFQVQKQSPRLILARKKDHFLYKGSPFAPDFGEENFYYNALILNCPYNCDYCYLQGMYPSGNIVVFVNLEDYFKATDEFLERLGKLYLCLSYDTDLLGMESWTGYSAEWIEYARERPNLTLELRTKSANWKSLSKIQPVPNFILAWTISPQEMIERYEKKTASLMARIRAMKQALEVGWEVRGCIDPILYVPGWRDVYGALLDLLYKEGVLVRLRELSLGTFRMNEAYFKRIKKLRRDSDLYLTDFVKEENAVRYPQKRREEMLFFVEERLQRILGKEFKAFQNM